MTSLFKRVASIPFILALFILFSCSKSDEDNTLPEVYASFTIDGTVHEFEFKNNRDCSGSVKSFPDGTTITAIAICNEGNKNTPGNCLGKYMAITIGGNKPGVYPGIDNNNDGTPEIGIALYDDGNFLYMSPINDTNSSITVLQFNDYITARFNGELIDAKATEEQGKTIIVSATGEFKAYIIK